MMVLGGGVVSYERGTPVIRVLSTPRTLKDERVLAHQDQLRALGTSLLQGPGARRSLMSKVQGYLAHKKTPTPLGPP